MSAEIDVDKGRMVKSPLKERNRTLNPAYLKL